ncbi:MAG: pirin family protein [Betaproteobacteria bacterium]
MIERVIDQRRRDLGGGFEVGRVLPWAHHRMVGPFVFFDQMGPVDLPAGIPRSLDVRPHPHIGLATVTYLFDGEIVHRDSLGFEQPIRPGELNWMTAGRGITHSERFERARRQGDPLFGIQAWVGLPAEHEEDEPSFAHHAGDAMPTYETRGLRARLVAGEAYGVKSPVRTLSPLFYVHWRLDAGVSAGLEARYPERAAYVAAGSIEADGQVFEAGRMVVFAPGDTVTIRARTDATVMLLGGEPIGPRHIEWNFVSSSRERIEEAKADWAAGRMKLPVHDDQEWTPLPSGPPREPPPAS